MQLNMAFSFKLFGVLHFDKSFCTTTRSRLSEGDMYLSLPWETLCASIACCTVHMGKSHENADSNALVQSSRCYWSFLSEYPSDSYWFIRLLHVLTKPKEVAACRCQLIVSKSQWAEITECSHIDLFPFWLAMKIWDYAQGRTHGSAISAVSYKVGGAPPTPSESSLSPHTTNLTSTSPSLESSFTQDCL